MKHLGVPVRSSVSLNLFGIPKEFLEEEYSMNH